MTCSRSNRMQVAESQMDGKNPPRPPSPAEALWSLSLEEPLESSKYPQNILISDFTARQEHLALVGCVSTKGKSLCIFQALEMVAAFNKKLAASLWVLTRQAQRGGLTANEALRQLQ